MNQENWKIITRENFFMREDMIFLNRQLQFVWLIFLFVMYKIYKKYYNQW